MQLAAVDPKKAQQQMTHPCDDHMLEEPQQIEASCLMKTVDSATQLTAPANEMYPACDASTQTPMNWRMRGTQTFSRSWSRGKTHPSEYDELMVKVCVNSLCRNWFTFAVYLFM